MTVTSDTDAPRRLRATTPWAATNATHYGINLSSDNADRIIDLTERGR